LTLFFCNAKIIAVGELRFLYATFFTLGDIFCMRKAYSTNDYSIEGVNYGNFA